MKFTEIEQYMMSGKRCHLVGIGGVSVSALAEVLHGMNIPVSGSDMSKSPTTDKMCSLGIDVVIGHRADNVNGAGYIIRTAAAREDNVEVIAAREQGIPVIERAQAWGYIMSKYKNAVCIAGVHGKTSTTSMLTHVLLGSHFDPTVMIGGTLPLLESGHRVGNGDTIVVESCEYYNSFHNFCPTVAVILNVDADHLDFFNDLGDLKDSFCKFASLVPKNGHIVCNADDENTMQALVPLGRDLFTFGFNETGLYTSNTESSHPSEIPIRVRGVNVVSAGRNPSMEVLFDNKPLCKISLQIPGMHNLSNALATVAASHAIGIPAHDIEKGLYDYKGVGRRFEFKGNVKGADVYDDYAHHPKELKATIDAVSTLGYKRIILAFQPHTYTRTKALFDDFVTELSRPDYTFLAPIYAAREMDDKTISSGILADAVKNAVCLSSLQEIAHDIEAMARPGDIILTAGAGDIYLAGEMLVKS